MSIAREYTCKLLDMIDEGLISQETALSLCLGWMSEADVKDMMIDEGIVEEFEDELQEESDSFVDFSDRLLMKLDLI